MMRSRPLCTCSEIEERVDHFASGLEEERLTPPNPDGLKLLALYSRNRPEWVIAEQVSPPTPTEERGLAGRAAAAVAVSHECRGVMSRPCNLRDYFPFQIYSIIRFILSFPDADRFAPIMARKLIIASPLVLEVFQHRKRGHRVLVSSPPERSHFLSLFSFSNSYQMD